MKMNIPFQKTLMLIAIIGILLISGCTQSNQDTSTKGGETLLHVVTTTNMIGDVTKEIAKDNVKVSTMMGAGIDPHSYKASASDVQLLSSADLILYNGLHLEAKLGEVFEKMKTQKTVAVAEGILHEKLLLLDDDVIDPHVWHDITLWIEVVKVIKDELITLDPNNQATYEINAQTYVEKLIALDASIRKELEMIPIDQRVLITAHDAFNYYGRQYGIQVKGLQGISTEAEAGTKDVQDLVSYIVDNKIKAIFVESSIPERNIKAVQEAAKSKGWDVVIGGELFSDAAGQEGTYQGTYIGMVDTNTKKIVNALK